MRSFDPSKSERRGMIILALAFLVLVSAVFIFFQRRQWTPNTEEKSKDSLFYRSNVSSKGHSYYAVPVSNPETFPFDPNTADSTTLLRLGFPPFMVRNIYRYRAKGGRYHTPEDLSRTYGMTHELWDRIAPCIRIDEKYQYMDGGIVTSSHQQSYRDSVVNRSTKIKQGETIDLNRADTIQLKTIPGIGSFYARAIVSYREKLGGFVSLSQLSEIEDLPEDFSSWFRLETTQVHQIDVNHATKQELARHPYIRAYRARIIMDHRRKYGSFHSLQELKILLDFTDEDVRKLSPYLIFK